MPSRAKRALIALTILGGAFLYLKGATHFEQRAIAAQAPAVAAGQAVARHVDRAQLMNDLRALADPGARRPASRESSGGLKARAWVEAQFGAIGLTPAGSSGYRQPFEFTHSSVKGFFCQGGRFARRTVMPPT